MTRSRRASRRRSIRIDATEELANILLSSSGTRKQRYEDIVDLIPYADLNSKVITKEDEYTPIGKLSIDWDLPGVKSLFEIFLEYEYLPMMGNLLENENMRMIVQNTMQMFVDHGAHLTSCHPDITSLLEDMLIAYKETSKALISMEDVCFGIPSSSNIIR